MVAVLLLDGAIKLVQIAPVTETMSLPTRPPATPSASLTLLCTALYAWPPTSLLGAVRLTGYLGGAIAMHARIDSPLFSHTLFGLYLGLLLWAGLWLRDPRVRLVSPVRGD